MLLKKFVYSKYITEYEKTVHFLMACCSGCARWLIGIVSICVIICAVVAGIVVYKKEKDKDWSKLIKNNITFIFILVAMCCAVVSSIIGFLLCCCKARCLYVTYLVIIVIVIIIEIVAIVLAFTFKDKIIDGIEENWYKPKFEESRESIESSKQCCGFRDYKKGDPCGYEDPDKSKPCYQQINDEINSNMKGLRISVIVMVVVEAVLLVCAIYLTVTSKDE